MGGPTREVPEPREDSLAFMTTRHALTQARKIAGDEKIDEGLRERLASQMMQLAYGSEHDAAVCVNRIRQAGVPPHRDRIGSRSSARCGLCIHLEPG